MKSDGINSQDMVIHGVTAADIWFGGFTQLAKNKLEDVSRISPLFEAQIVGQH